MIRRKRIPRFLSLLFLFWLFLISSGIPCFADSEVKLWHQWAGRKRALLQSALGDFNCRGDAVTVTSQIFGPASGSVVEQLLVATEKPHLALVERDALPLLADKGLILPFEHLLASSELLNADNWLPSARAYVSYKGHLYGVPATLNPYLLLYNPELLSKVGGKPPSDWSDLLHFRESLQTSPAAPAAKWVLNTRSMDSLFSILCVQNGIDTLEQSKVVRKKEAMANIFKYVRELREQGLMPPYYKFWDPSFVDLADGNLLFQIEDAAELAQMEGTISSLAVAPMPSRSGNFQTALSDSPVFVLCRSDQEKTVADFLQFFFSSSQYKTLQERLFFVCPFKKKDGQAEKLHSPYPEVLKAAEHATPFLLSSACATAFSRAARVVARLDAGLISPEQALEEMLQLSAGEGSSKRESNAPITVSWAESTRRLFPNADSCINRPPVIAACAGNEHETFQLLISNNTEPGEISWKWEPFRDSAGVSPDIKTTVYIESDTEIRTPLVADTPGRYPNVLERAPSVAVKPGRPARLWIDVFVSGDVPAGRYASTLALLDNGKPAANLPVKLTVFPFRLPSAPTQPAVIGLNYDLIARHYGVKQNSEAGHKLMDSFYWFLVEHRLTPYQPPVPLDSPSMHEYLQDERVCACRVPFPPGNPLFDAVVEHAVKGGWLKKLFVYFIDEPTYHQYPAVVQTGEDIHSRKNHPRFLVTCFPDEMLAGAVDIWCIDIPFLPVGIPHSSADRREYLSRVEERVAAGDEVWWYTAGPARPFPTLHIEDDPAAFRVIPWLQQLLGVQGFLQWEAANWIQPLDQPFIPWFGNGEGVLVYPGDLQPNPSIRLELMREGLEDLEYLFLLRHGLEDVQRMLSAESLGDVPTRRVREICRRLISPEALMDPTGAFPLMFFVRKPGAIERVRAEVAAEIVAVRNRPLALVLTEPEEKQYTEADSVRIYGVTEPSCTLRVNGRTWSAEPSGAFSIRLPLTAGTNDFDIVFDNGTDTKVITRKINRI